MADFGLFRTRAPLLVCLKIFRTARRDAAEFLPRFRELGREDSFH